MYLILMCCETARLSPSPTGTISSYYETKSVFLAVGIMTLVCIAVRVFSFQTKVDFIYCAGVFCVLCFLSVESSQPLFSLFSLFGGCTWCTLLSGQSLSH